MLKILLALDAYVPVVDGSITAFLSIARGLKKFGHHVSCIVPSDPLANGNSEFPIFRIPSLPFPFYKPYRVASPWSLSALKKQLQNAAFDIVHVHSPFGVGIVARNFAYERNIPCIYTYHTLFHEELHYIGPFQRILHRPFLAYIRTFCASVVHVATPSEQSKKLLLQQYGIKNSVEVLPTGIDSHCALPVTTENLRKQHGIPPHIPIILYVGRLVKEKNLPLLIQALKTLKEKGREFRCILVGDGNYRQQLELLIRESGLTGCFHLTGLLSHEQQEQRNLWFAQSDIFCTPSLVETQCLAAVEAMINGLPVIGAKAMGLCQTITEGVNGILAEPNVDDFSRALDRLLQDSALRKKLGNGAVQLSKNMSADICVQKHIACYEKILSRKYDEATKRPIKPLSLIARSLWS